MRTPFIVICVFVDMLRCNSIFLPNGKIDIILRSEFRYVALGDEYAINPSRLRSKHIECAAHIVRLGAYRKSRK